MSSNVLSGYQKLVHVAGILSTLFRERQTRTHKPVCEIRDGESMWIRRNDVYVCGNHYAANPQARTLSATPTNSRREYRKVYRESNKLLVDMQEEGRGACYLDLITALSV